MAWNTPGGKDKDPWTGQNQQRPPELDELWRKFWNNFKNLFQKKFSHQPQYSGHIHKWMTSVVLLIVFSIWLLSGIYIVSPAEQAVILRFGQYVETVGPGPHWIPRLIETKHIVNVGKLNQLSFGSQKDPVYLLTKDESIVAVSAVVQYRINNSKEYLFNTSNPTQSLQQVIATAMQQVIGKNTLEEIFAANQTTLSQQVMQELNQILALYKTGIAVNNVLMQPAQAPEEVKDKFEEANRALEDEKRLINQANAYAESMLPIAQSKAQRLTQEANAYKQKVILEAQGETQRFLALLPQYQRAPNIMKERLYFDAMETILTKTSKIVIDSSANNMIYLPLEQLMQFSENTSSITPTQNKLTDSSEKNITTQSKETDGTSSGYVAAAQERMQRMQMLRQQREGNRDAGDKR